MVVGSFTWARGPRVVFGPGCVVGLGTIAASYGRSVGLVIGCSSLRRSGALREVERSLGAAGVTWRTYEVSGEPTPALVDEVAGELRARGCGVVIGVGGGSVLDAGKAIAAMVPQEGGAEAYLEKVGDREHDGRRLPCVAVPTTAGTGSEATYNAVLSRVGGDGFKASLRHPNLSPDVALVDPELALSCPREVTAACGMDALTQLLEAYVSRRASALSDALALSGLGAVRDSLVRACEGGEVDLEARSGMAYASLMSGFALANAGLGTVHGLAGEMGGLYAIPHGVACGTLVGVVTRVSIEKLRAAGGAGLRRYSEAGRLLGATSEDVEGCCGFLVERLAQWTEGLGLPRLGAYGVDRAGVDAIAERASNKNNPVAFEVDEMRAVLLERL